MHRKILTLFSFLLLLTQVAFSQAAQKPQEPEYIGVFAFLDATGNLRELERQTPVEKIKIKGMGFGGGEGYLQIKGEQSPIRFKADQKLEFVVRASSQQTDPVSIIQFFRLETKKGNRQLLLSKVKPFAVGAKETASQSAVSFNVAKYGEFSFKVVPAYALTPGEYCFSGQGSKDGFCFGIDPAGSETR